MTMENIFLKDFFSTLNKNYIEYCVLRNYETLPKTLNGSDLDILIASKSINSFYETLNLLLLKYQGKIVIKYGKLTPRICILIHFKNKFYGIQLDVHEGVLPYKTLNMFSVDSMLKRSNVHNDIFVANDNDANLVAFLKEILHNKKCKKKYFLLAKESWIKNDFYKKELLSIYPQNFIDNLNNLLLDTYDEDKIEKLAKKGQKVLTNGFSNKIKIFKLNLDKLYRFKKRPGVIVAMMGTDGAGKTTIINEILKPLNEAVHNAVYYEHMRPNLIPNIAQLFGKKKQIEPISNPHASKPSGVIGSLLRLFYYSFDYIVGFWFKIYPVMVKKSSIWIFDRYYYDYIIDPKRARISLPQWVIGSMNFFIPKPDLIICFGAEAEVIYKRKPEHSLDEVKNQVNKLKLFCENNSQAIWIDTGVSIDKSVEETLDTISTMMSKRYI